MLYEVHIKQWVSITYNVY